MRTGRLLKEDGTVVAERLALATNPLTRLRGLLGRRGLPPGEGILLRPAFSIHMAFMRFPIDALFLDKELTVVDVVRDLAPWKTATRRGAHAVVELASGEAAARGVTPGERLRLDA